MMMRAGRFLQNEEEEVANTKAFLLSSSPARYPGSTFMDHVLRYQDTPGIKMIVVLGEVGLPP